jgi:hypothetical protein
VVARAGHLEACKVRPGDGGTLTLVCAGNEPMLLDYRLSPKESYPRFRVQLDAAGKVERVQIRPAREVDWRPLAYVVLTVGAVLGGGRWIQDSDDHSDRPVSPSSPR